MRVRKIMKFGIFCGDPQGGSGAIPYWIQILKICNVTINGD